MSKLGTKIHPEMVSTGSSGGGIDYTSTLILIKDSSIPDDGSYRHADIGKNTTEIFGKVNRLVIFHDKDVRETDRYMFIEYVDETSKDSINELVKADKLLRI